MTAREPNVAVRAEPATVGTARARDRLALEVRLLGSLLGQVIAEQAGPDLLDLVERIRRTTIRLRRENDLAERETLAATLADLDLPRAEVVIRAFSLYFRLVNLAEERDQVRSARRRERATREDPIAATVASLRGAPNDDALQLVQGLRITPVLTAHPTEARRRTLLLALRRVDRLLARLEDPDLPPSEDRDARRRLREEITLLWRTADLRAVTPSPLDEVRTALAFFDETLFSAVPRVLRATDAALDEIGGGRRGRATRSATGEAADTGRTGTRAPLVPAFLRWGSWIGGDRDGNPNVTAEITERTLRIHADHVLRGYEAVATRLSQTLAAASPVDPVPDEAPSAAARALATRLARDAELLPELDRQLGRRFPHEPYRQRFGFIAERLRRTRAYLTGHQAPLTGRYGSAAELDEELAEAQDALVEDGLERVAWGEVQDFRWQVATFGFHLAALELRQHSAVHAAALAALRRDPAASSEVAPGVTADEVAATFRSVASLQARYGEDAIDRYVVSFTASSADVTAVLELAELGGLGGVSGGSVVPLDVVPLFEDAATLEQAGPLLDEILRDDRYRTHLRSRGDRQEVMLGYSDSNK
ncbi:MAG: phosphoenolpyruvate carboxylase, partial [Chloroflexota bacterium]